MNLVNKKLLCSFGIPSKDAENFAYKINFWLKNLSPPDAWQQITKEFLSPNISFALHLLLFSICYPEQKKSPEHAYSFIVDDNVAKTTHLAQFMYETGHKTLQSFHAWTVHQREAFWEKVLQKLTIYFTSPPKKICDLSKGVEYPTWLLGAKLNITDSCFTAPPHKTAIIFSKNNTLQKFSYHELLQTTNNIANNLIAAGCKAGDPIGIIMPMHFTSIAIYLGIIRMGGIAVPVPESFSAEEICKRLTISQVKIVFTQDQIQRDKDIFPLYQKVMQLPSSITIIVHQETQQNTPLRISDSYLEKFLQSNRSLNYHACIRDPSDDCTILFSSGTTGSPKAIPWTHLTPVKAASDAFLHLNIQSNDVIAWPTSLGWMMGPWLIFAALINKATIALSNHSPTNAAFCQFIEKTKVSVLGVVPTLVAKWRENKATDHTNWKDIRLFVSTGECSNPEDMLFLASRAGYKPIIEYCGGTEIGGAYITSTLIENNAPSILTTPAMGIDFILLDEQGRSADRGEVALIPPSIGLSTKLLNANHHAIYYENMPTLPEHTLLRRHGDAIERLAENKYRMLGRIDDTMNIGGIKVSASEIERTLIPIDFIQEVAAIAVSEESGPTKLIIYVVLNNTNQHIEKNKLHDLLQKHINQHLNPLFHIDAVILLDKLPRTISGKILRRELRNLFTKERSLPNSKKNVQ